MKTLKALCWALCLPLLPLYLTAMGTGFLARLVWFGVEDGWQSLEDLVYDRDLRKEE